MQVAQNILQLKLELSSRITMVAVSKTHPPDDILEAYQTGHRDFGENKVQELSEKSALLPKDIRWHMIGHLQTNKVKFIAPFVHLIHGVDSIKLLEIIQKEGIKRNRCINCLLQTHIALEESKFGLSQSEIIQIFESGVLEKLTAVRICGLMGMASNTEDETQIRREFRELHQLFTTIQIQFPNQTVHFNQLSMGMSDDYPIAIEEGSTLIRVGSKIFGHREYAFKP